jgi:hypothetical protein
MGWWRGDSQYPKWLGFARHVANAKPEAVSKVLEGWNDPVFASADGSIRCIAARLSECAVQPD